MSAPSFSNVAVTMDALGMDVKYKYAIVRVKESSVIDFFGLIIVEGIITVASNGYSDVSFVSNLNQAIARPDPNDDAGTSTSTKNDDRVADSEDHCSVSATPVSPGEEFVNGNTVKRLPNTTFNMITIPKIEKDEPNLEDEMEDGGDLNIGTFPQGSAPIDLVSGLFATLQHKMPVIGSEWTPSTDMKTRQFVSNHSRIPPYKQIEGFQTRMKGWQREYIKDIIKEGHYPTEDELRDIEVKCDLSRKQVLRFIAKRVGNPNRKPRDGRLPPATAEEIQQTLEKFNTSKS
ncbi:hypothetical protein DICVIV_03969 [Dictyocaulus viviparus]|uniref:Uncharacterized protein n=1 Tax=Dictyocaulus viviparus TaxID=29172 RepID=A0A0D8XYY7_DICVI|nr:hypothetical protein DICVIV_03969 [Dictyocaulus viviparus]